MIKKTKIALGGGLDQASPVTSMNPGRLLNAENVEAKRRGGYRRMLGYDKYDANEIAGEGKIRGVWMFNDKVYAVRNVVGGATAKMWESSGSGWTECNLGKTLSFTSGGTTEIAAGDTITGATSAATAVVVSVRLTGGSWAGGDAAGEFHLKTVSGTFQAENLDVGASTNLATIAGDASAVTLAADGEYEFYNYAFAGTEKMYAVSGVHKGFEWDGAGFSFITTGMVTDTPNHLIAHRKHLFFSYGSSLQISGLGDPLSWTLLTGAAERVMNHAITGFAKLSGGVLGIFTRREISVLAGTSSADWAAEDFSEYGNNAGAVEGSIQQMGSNVRFMDSRGISDFYTSQKSGDFDDALISNDVEKLIKDKANSVTTSVVVRDKDQYRIFFDDGTGLVFVFSQNGVMPTQMRFPNVVQCACSAEDSNGTEYILFGSDSGFIYRMESGNSFGGAAITALIDTAYTNMGVEAHTKRFRWMLAGIQSEGVVTVYFRGDYREGVSGLPRPDIKQVDFPEGALTLGNAALGTTYLGGTPISEGHISLEGRGDWASFRFYSSSASEPVWEIDKLTVGYLLGRQRR